MLKTKLSALGGSMGPLDCVHHWDIDPAHEGEKSRGECRNCGKVDYFRNSDPFGDVDTLRVPRNRQGHGEWDERLYRAEEQAGEE